MPILIMVPTIASSSWGSIGLPAPVSTAEKSRAPWQPRQVVLAAAPAAARSGTGGPWSVMTSPGRHANACGGARTAGRWRTARLPGVAPRLGQSVEPSGCCRCSPSQVLLFELRSVLGSGDQIVRTGRTKDLIDVSPVNCGKECRPHDTPGAVAHHDRYLSADVYVSSCRGGSMIASRDRPGS